MNKCMIIGNLTADPELRTTQSGIAVCNFTVAVNRRGTAQAGQPEADFFRVTAWRQLGENCARYLAKGRKVGVTGQVSAGSYTNSQGQAVGTLNVQAEDVEFLTPKGDQPTPAGHDAHAHQSTAVPAGYAQVEEEDLPF